MSDLVQFGDTVRLKATFHDFANGALADPAAVTAKIYNSSQIELQTATAVKESVGVYHYDYTSTAKGVFFYEFSGQLEGTPAVRRDKLTVVFTTP
jgi:hypothetical protein